jgi:ATP-dependent Clp endopeptidase proteolytic subunit ClpP
VADSSVPTSPEKDRVQVNQGPHRELNDRIVSELIDAVKSILRKEQSDRLRDIYLIGDIEKDTARGVIERLRELANDNNRPITLYINSAGGNVTDGLAIHDAIREVVGRNIEVTIVVQGMAYSMGSVVLQAASTGRRLSYPHSWIMIHEPAKWAGWQSTSAAAGSGECSWNSRAMQRISVQLGDGGASTERTPGPTVYQARPRPWPARHTDVHRACS